MTRENDESWANYRAVIPGRDEVASPESITSVAEYRFRARRLRGAPE